MSLCPDREALVLENRGLIGCVLKRLSIPSHEWDEFHSIGDMGLVLAAQMYDHRRGTRFSTYAYVSIRNHVLSELRQRAKLRAIEQLPDVPAEVNGHDPQADLQSLLSLLTKGDRLKAERVFGLNGRRTKLTGYRLYQQRKKLLVELQWLAQQQRLGG